MDPKDTRFCTISRTRKFLLLAVVVTVAVTLFIATRVSQKISVPIKLAEPRVRNETRDQTWIIMHTSRDVCEDWKNAFPEAEILLIGVIGMSNIGSTTKRCHYVDHFSSKVEEAIYVITAHPREIFLVSDGGRGRECVHQTSATDVERRHPRDGGSSPHNDMPSNDNYSPRYVLGGITSHGPITTMYLDPNEYPLLQVDCLRVPPESFWLVPYLDIREKENTHSAISRKLHVMSGTRMFLTLPKTKEIPLVTEMDKSSSVVRFLNRHHCDEIASLDDCIYELKNAMKKNGHISHFEAEEYMIWIARLEDHLFSLPAVQPSSVLGTGEIAHSNLVPRAELLEKICPGIPPPSMGEEWKLWKDVVLIVAFSIPNYHVIPYVDTLYRPLFPNIIYCGPTKLFQKVIQNFKIKFIKYNKRSVGHAPGSFKYDCFIMAVQMMYKAKGYLVISDDVMLIPPRVQYFDLNKSWYWSKDMIETIDSNCKSTKCQMSIKAHGLDWKSLPELNSKLRKEIKEVGVTSNGAAFCSARLTSITGLPNALLGGSPDVYYIPERYANLLSEVFEIFLKYEVHSQIALATAILCTVDEMDLEPMYTIVSNKRCKEETYNSGYSPEIAKPCESQLKIENPRQLDLMDSFRIPMWSPEHLREFPHEPWRHVNSFSLNGVSFYRPIDLKSVEQHLLKHEGFFCALNRFFADKSGKATFYLDHISPDYTDYEQQQENAQDDGSYDNN